MLSLHPSLPIPFPTFPPLISPDCPSLLHPHFYSWKKFVKFPLEINIFRPREIFQFQVLNLPDLKWKRSKAGSKINLRKSLSKAEDLKWIEICDIIDRRRKKDELEWRDSRGQKTRKCRKQEWMPNINWNAQNKFETGAVLQYNLPN